MRFGCCGSMIAPAVDPIGVEAIDTLAEIGYDYIELSLADITALDEGRFLDLARRLERSAIRCETCNNFFPRTIRLTGPDASLERALDYAGRALDRAALLGARVVVFGSAGAKNVPEGFPCTAAWSQIAALLRRLGPMAEPLGITIAIEPICRLESNIVNLASDGLRLAHEVAHAHVQILIDYYHLVVEREPIEVVLKAGSALRHVHIAQPEGRRFPGSQESTGIENFFAALGRIGYDSRCSIEAFTDDFPADARRALAWLRAAAGSIRPSKEPTS